MSSKKSKKKHGKKQQFKYAAPVGAVQAAESVVAPAAPLPKASLATPTAAARTEVPGLSLIRHDVRRVLVLAGSFVALELGLWYLFGHTSLGSAVYRLIKL